MELGVTAEEAGLASRNCVLMNCLVGLGGGLGHTYGMSVDAAERWQCSLA